MNFTCEHPSESVSPTDCFFMFTTASGAIVIYDEHNHAAWIQSSAPVAIDDAR